MSFQYEYKRQSESKMVAGNLANTYNINHGENRNGAKGDGRYIFHIMLGFKLFGAEGVYHFHFFYHYNRLETTEICSCKTLACVYLKDRKLN